LNNKFFFAYGKKFGHNTISLNLFYQFGFEKWAHLPEVANLDGIYRDLIILGKKVKFN
jgi:phosphinothricin acetyltransferase